MLCSKLNDDTKIYMWTNLLENHEPTCHIVNGDQHPWLQVGFYEESPQCDAHHFLWCCNQKLEQVGVMLLEPWVQPPCPRHAHKASSHLQKLYLYPETQILKDYQDHKGMEKLSSTGFCITSFSCSFQTKAFDPMISKLMAVCQKQMLIINYHMIHGFF